MRNWPLWMGALRSPLLDEPPASEPRDPRGPLHAWAVAYVDEDSDTPPWIVGEPSSEEEARARLKSERDASPRLAGRFRLVEVREVPA